MNRFRSRSPHDFDSAIPAPLRPTPSPTPSSLSDSFGAEGINRFGSVKMRSNQRKLGRVHSSALVDLKDPVQMHLLTETALLDSKGYEILSQEEVDDLKKQRHILNQRIEQVRSSLAIQSKYRDAAMSMSKLYSPPSSASGRKSFRGHRHTESSEAAREAEQELSAIQKKCDDLAWELWALEKRAIEPQRKLLEHTAAILQFTHKAANKPAAPTPRVPLLNGVPASPESMYTTSNSRDSLNMDFLEDGHSFDEASFYLSFNPSDKFEDRTRPSPSPSPMPSPNPNPIEIPMKSPIRGQNKQLTQETEKLREENRDLRTQNNSLMSEMDQMKAQSGWNLITETETKLESLNYRLRDVIVGADPAKNADYRDVPSGRIEPGDMIGSHLDYLENGLITLAQTGVQGNNTVEVASQIEAQNVHIQNVLRSANIDRPAPPDVNLGVDEQLDYLQDSLRIVEEELRRGPSADLALDNRSDPDTILKGLWDTIQTGYADIRQRKQNRRKARLEKGLEPDEADMSDGESFDFDEQYSLFAFSAKVQWLYTQATKLQEQKGVLKRQIKQQRELNSRSDSEKDQALQEKMDELDEAKGSLHLAEKETDKIRSQLSQAMNDLEMLQKSRDEESSVMDEARERLKERNAKIASLEASNRDMQAHLVVAETNVEAITARLEEAIAAKEAADKAVQDKEDALKAQEEELGQMTGMVAELKMEATLAKAELDGAYGSRKERAAEVAALHNTSESAKIQNRVAVLEKELKATAVDLTNVVKQSVESEKKIAELEDELDRVKTERSKLKEEKDNMSEELEKRLYEATGDLEERLESEIARLRKEKEQLQDELDKERLGSARGPLSPAGNKGTTYLTDSYRLGLRAERKKYEEQLRAEQMVRRKIEDELRTLKRAQGPGKSPLTTR